MIKLALTLIFLTFIIATMISGYIVLSNEPKPIRKLCIDEELHELTQQQELIKLTTETNDSIICQGVTNP